MSSEFYAGDCNHVCGACQRPGHTRAECPATVSSDGMHGRLSAGAGGSGPSSPMVTRIAALEAENARLVAQLAAIQGGMGEVETWQAQIQRENPKSDPVFWPDSLVIQAQRREIADLRRITAAMAAEVERLTNEASALAAVACDGVVGDDYGHAYCRYKSELDKLRAELETARKQEPIVTILQREHGFCFSSEDTSKLDRLPDGTKLYAHQPMVEKVAVSRGLLERMYLNGVVRIDDIREIQRALADELAAVKGQEAFPVAWRLRKEVDSCGLNRYMTQEKYSAQSTAIQKWYEPFRCASCDASPDVEGLVKALEDCAGRLRLLIDSRRHKMLDVVAEEKARTALSTWRQAQASQQKGKA